MKNLIIIGAGGAGLEALLVARRMGGWKIEGFADDALSLTGTSVEGVPVLGTLEDVVSNNGGAGVHFYCSLGNNRTRKAKAELFESRGFLPATLIDPSAVVAESAGIGEGAYIGAQVFVGPQAVVKRYVIVNVSASVGHHSVTEDYAQICPGARISGYVKLGEGALVGSNAVVVPGVAIGDWSVLGAASFASRDIAARLSAIGVPARVIAPAPN